MSFYTNDITLMLLDENGGPSRALAEKAIGVMAEVLRRREYDVTAMADPEHPSKRLIEDMTMEDKQIRIAGPVGYFYPGGETMTAQFLQEIVGMIPFTTMILTVKTTETYSSSSIVITFDHTLEKMTEVYSLQNNDGYNYKTTTVYQHEKGTFTQISQESENIGKEDCVDISFVFYAGFEQDLEKLYDCKLTVFRDIFEDVAGGVVEDSLSEDVDFYVYGEEDTEDDLRAEAEELGITTISRDEFFTRFLDLKKEMENY